MMDPMRREILRLLAPRAETGNGLSKTLGMSPSAVCYHLQALKAAGFIRVEKLETESHGMVQKFYRASALAFLIDCDKLPLDMKRYFGPLEIERARGLVAALLMRNAGFDPSVDLVQGLCETFSRSVVQVVVENNGTFDVEDPEGLIAHIYQEALSRLLGSDTQSFRRLSHAVPLLPVHH